MFLQSEIIKIVKIKDMKTELKDGKGNLGLVLECYGDKGTLSEISIPDIDLNIAALELTRDDWNWCSICVPGKKEGYISFKLNEDKNGNLYTYRKLERTVSKSELEKELGYKLNII